MPADAISPRMSHAAVITPIAIIFFHYYFHCWYY
jgi:hypothetical protein